MMIQHRKTRRYYTTLTAIVISALVAGCEASGGQPASNEPGQAATEGPCEPVEVKGFQTCADLDAAKSEGTVVLYTSIRETTISKLQDEFNSLFPEIEVQYVQAQTGQLYAKLNAEMDAERPTADIIHLPDMSLVLDFLEKGRFKHYPSPQNSFFDEEAKSDPAGYWTSMGDYAAGIAYNPEVLSPEEAPKTWEDLLDPKFQERISFKTSASGVQHTEWYLLRDYFGDDYWQEMAAQEPVAFDSVVQCYDRIINGTDLVTGMGQYNNYLLNKREGKPVEFVVPPKGMPATPGTLGIVSGAPHQEAAKLFYDWILSKQGQKLLVDIQLWISRRSDVAPPKGGLSQDELNLVYPDDWKEFSESGSEFASTWQDLLGLS